LAQAAQGARITRIGSLAACAMPRCVPNPCKDLGAEPPSAPTSDDIWPFVQGILQELDECAAYGAMLSSTGKYERNYSVYTGLSGIALTYLRVGLHCKGSRGSDADVVTYFTKARDTAMVCLSKEPKSREVSFFCGTPGHIAICAAASALLGDGAAAASQVRALLGWADRALQNSEDELLFGRAGYIYALLWVRKYCDVGCDADFDLALSRTAEGLVASGVRRARTYKGWPLMWHCFDEPYLGAAHGVVGILAMLFRCYQSLSPNSQQLVCAALRKTLEIRHPSGNMPIVLGAHGDDHVHWCHGAPGLPFLYYSAAAALGDEEAARLGLHAAAAQAGEVVWERGVILKGNGLCHGLAGNGYTFLSLYRATGELQHLTRAVLFGRLFYHQALQDAMRRQPDPQRRVPGVPDSPRSLMEGSAGVVCFVLDLSAAHDSAFPAWEL